MRKYTQKELKKMVANGFAIDVTKAGSRDEIPEHYTQVGYSARVYGCNGMLLQGDETGNYYAVTARTTAIYVF